jgi:hypothetical protein
MNESFHKLFQNSTNLTDNALDVITILTGLACAVAIALSLIGNTLVVTVILRFKHLQNATNFILLSLAIADLTVSLLVMIPSMIYDIKKKWIFSRLFCKFYNAFDITCCTASILHLLLVALDRYVAIFRPLSYRNMVRKCYVFAIVAFVWLLSACMSFIPIFMGFNGINYWSNINQTDGNQTQSLTNSDDQCPMEANLPYAIVSSSLSFYIPLILMTIVYIQIYIVARRQAHAIAEIAYNQRKHANNARNPHDETALNNNHALAKTYSCMTIDANEVNFKLIDSRSKSRRRTKDTKAIRTLGIIMGIFIICWLPFFVMYLYAAFCPSCVINTEIIRLITWIGYINSFINPIVYAFTSRYVTSNFYLTFKSI